MSTSKILVITTFILIITFAFSKDKLHSKIHDYVQQLKSNPQHLGILQEWIQQESLPGNETGIQNLIKIQLERLGFEVDTYYIDEKVTKHPNFYSPRKDFSTSPNIVGVLRSKQVSVGITGDVTQEKGGKSLILNGHVDVVPVGDLKTWKHSPNPFSGDVKNGKLYGRGTTDMKGGIFASLIAVEVIRGLNITLKGDLILQSVVEEESGGAGTLSTILRGYKADGAIIPEPTDLKIFPKQQGSTWFRIKIHGKGAHGGTRYFGVSAIEKSLHVIKRIQELESIRTERIRKTEPLMKDLPIPVPINIGKINGGKWPSSVADLVVIEGRFGIAPSERLDDAKAELKNLVDKMNSEDEWFQEHPIELEWFGGTWLPGNVDPNSEIVNTLKEAFSETKNEQPIIEASPWGTDAGLLTNVANIPAIVFGPGETLAAHQSDEYISIDKIYECGEILANFILKFCGFYE